MKKLVISSHNIRSTALKNLQKELSEQLGYYVYRVKPDRVRRRVAVHFNKGVDKLTQFKKFHENETTFAPAYATSLDGAAALPSDLVCVRKLLRGSQGSGLVVVERGNLNSAEHTAKLYTEYIKKYAEYRAHVYNNKVIDVAQKKKRTGVTERDTRIRNTANGYVFCRASITIPDDLHDVALSAVSSLGFTQGAVDIVYNKKKNKCYALEVNSRPGMEGSTVKKWAEAILKDLT